jgi:hypothetical protein
VQDGSGGGTVLLPRVAVDSLHDVVRGNFEVSGVVHDHGVLAARLDEDALIQRCSGICRAASSLILNPVSTDPVNVMKRVRASVTRWSPISPPYLGQKFKTPSGRQAGLVEDSATFAAMTECTPRALS